MLHTKTSECFTAAAVMFYSPEKDLEKISGEILIGLELGLTQILQFGLILIAFGLIFIQFLTLTVIVIEYKSQFYL